MDLRRGGRGAIVKARRPTPAEAFKELEIKCVISVKATIKNDLPGPPYKKPTWPVTLVPSPHCPLLPAPPRHPPRACSQDVRLGECPAGARAGPASQQLPCGPRVSQLRPFRRAAGWDGGRMNSFEDLLTR